MTPEAALYGLIAQHVEVRMSRRLDYAARRILVGRRWCKRTGRSDAERAEAAAEWNAACAATSALLTRR